MKFKVRPWGFGSHNWVWCIVNSSNKEIATSHQMYSAKASAARAARHYAKKFTFAVFELGIKK